ncbi:MULTISPECIES: helix-turn-helix domain-containing protein [unclassified Sedimentibacter]|uniref:helix-turn-helix domain-containing protein n=1 Tax=unclassified Sedimentibacter TaxID=2649220 RepID=UPI0027E1C379|nr:helix-turn-helix transcriptional regulator [Sedimentibacter sp. MB35-C1]WMJ78452.1 helix-turn-helix transcriptional regulator [Sedimentibacter sp. MB35-C1]
MSILSKRIKQRREELGYSQQELATKLGYKSRSTIAKIEGEDNDIPQSKIKIFADALETTPTWLMGWESDPTKLGDNKFMGQNIKNTRLSKGYSLEKLSKLTNRDITYLTKLENGEVEIIVSEIVDIANALGKSVLALVGWEKERTEKEIKEDEKEFALHTYADLLAEYLDEGVKKIINSYYQLNDIGKNEAVERIEELTYIHKYKNQDDDTMDNDNF